MTSVVIIMKATLCVSPMGELIATEDDQRFFPVDGFVEMDDDEIAPFQITVAGQQEYYKLVPLVNTSQQAIEHEIEEEDLEGEKELMDDIDAAANGCLKVLAYVILGILSAAAVIKFIIWFQK